MKKWYSHILEILRAFFERSLRSRPAQLVPIKIRAFSLIELLIVITIIGILAVALLPTITNGPSRARDVQRIADVTDIALALEMYYQDYGSYPTSTGLENLPNNPTSGSYLNFKSYFDKGVIPVPSSGNYQYKSCASGQAYAIVATLENRKPASPAFSTNIDAVQTSNTNCKTTSLTAGGIYYILYKA